MQCGGAFLSLFTYLPVLRPSFERGVQERTEVQALTERPGGTRAWRHIAPSRR